jgi:hypothetical protein
MTTTSVTDRVLADWLLEQNSPQGEYECYTFDDATEKASEYIKDTLWAFDLQKLSDAGHLKVDLSDKAIEQLVKVQGELCEDCNEIITALVEDMNKLIDWAINCDGLGHFLSTYDGQSIDICVDDVWYVIVRVN